jgi:hypothetical protein
MQTVNFQCGNCNNLMAVGAEHIGQQVRCPHCQAIVVAPAAASPPAPVADAPGSLAPFMPPTDQEDIFAPPDASDDLFGRPETPHVELPPPPAMSEPTMVLDGAANPVAPAGDQAFGSTMTYVGPAAAPAPAPPGDATLPTWMEAPPAPAAPAPSPFPGTAVTDAAPAPEAAATVPHLVRKPRDGGGWFIGLIFIPLLSYSVLVTILAGYLFMLRMQKEPPPPSPLEMLPSFDPNDAEHSTHLKLDPDPKKLNRASGIDVALATSPLPDDLITQLGKKLRVGDLEVEPLRVTREVVSVDVEGFAKPEPCPYESLVLHMKLRNVSSNVAFQPMDKYFYRKWSIKAEPPPLTLLELIGPDKTSRFFGGPAEYPPPTQNAAQGNKYIEWVRGNDYERVLSPGDEMDAFVCTDGGKTEDDKEARAVVEAVKNHHGKLLWRVHLRRGIVVRDDHHYVPVSAVIGVEFTDEDYRKSS